MVSDVCSRSVNVIKKGTQIHHCHMYNTEHQWAGINMYLFLSCHINDPTSLDLQKRFLLFYTGIKFRSKILNLQLIHKKRKAGEDHIK